MSQETILFGTYQPLHRAGCSDKLKKMTWPYVEMMRESRPNDYPASFNEYGKDWDRGTRFARSCAEAIGFNPVWCFPCRDGLEAYVGSCIVAPNACDLFFLFESDKYVKIDACKWERTVVEKGDTCTGDDLVACVVTDLDDRLCEFLVPVDALSSYLLSVQPMFTYDLFFEAHKNVMFYSATGMRLIEYKTVMMSGDFVPVISAALAREMPNIDVDNIRFAGVDDDRAKYAAFARTMKFKFENTFLPFFVDLCHRGLEGSDIMSLFRSAMFLRKARELQTSVAAWSDDGASEAGRLRMWDGFASCYCDKIPIINMWLNGDRWPGRNEFCPCGSGLKFKKCCGRMYGLA